MADFSTNHSDFTVHHFTGFAVGLSGQNEAKFQKNVESFHHNLHAFDFWVLRKRDENHS